MIDETKQKVEAAREMIRALCHRERDWTMSVPARRDYDPDLVISDALTVLEQELAVRDEALRGAATDVHLTVMKHTAVEDLFDAWMTKARERIRKETV